MTALPNQTFGFIVVDNNGCLFGTVRGNIRDVLHTFTVKLSTTHNTSSSVRSARLKVEKRHNYVRKISETAASLFITGDAPNIAGIVLAGSASYNNLLTFSGNMDPRLLNNIRLVEIPHGGEEGFNQAIGQTADLLM